MKVALKKDPTQIGTIVEIYTTSTGQRRYRVQLKYGAIDADRKDFIYVEDEDGPWVTM